MFLFKFSLSATIWHLSKDWELGIGHRTSGIGHRALVTNDNCQQTTVNCQQTTVNSQLSTDFRIL
ncbi:hypothetical protein [Microcoleus sp. S13_C3]|uniref:hypothetical protein n=1 Tax=Microcoleus sp. S13_C3 TaxID=3055409 RepID=UPI002FD44B0D